MAKDEKGHGSDAHGVAGAVAKAFVKPGTTAIHPELGRVTIVKVNNDGSAVVRDSTGAQGTTMVRGLSQDSGGQPVASNAHAAATLAGGPKSAAVDTHPSMTEKPNAWGQYPKQAAEARAQLRSDRKQQLNKPPSQRRSYP
jgi:hypothetical protein